MQQQEQPPYDTRPLSVASSEGGGGGGRSQSSLGRTPSRLGYNEFIDDQTNTNNNTYYYDPYQYQVSDENVGEGNDGGSEDDDAEYLFEATRISLKNMKMQEEDEIEMQQQQQQTKTIRKSNSSGRVVMMGNNAMQNLPPESNNNYQLHHHHYNREDENEFAPIPPSILVPVRQVAKAASSSLSSPMATGSILGSPTAALTMASTTHAARHSSFSSASSISLISSTRRKQREQLTRDLSKGVIVHMPKVSKITADKTTAMLGVEEAASLLRGDRMSGRSHTSLGFTPQKATIEDNGRKSGGGGENRVGTSGGRSTVVGVTTNNNNNTNNNGNNRPTVPGGGTRRWVVPATLGSLSNTSSRYHAMYSGVEGVDTRTASFVNYARTMLAEYGVQQVIARTAPPSEKVDRLCFHLLDELAIVVRPLGFEDVVLAIREGLMTAVISNYVSASDLSNVEGVVHKSLLEQDDEDESEMEIGPDGKPIRRRRRRRRRKDEKLVLLGATLPNDDDNGNNNNNEGKTNKKISPSKNRKREPLPFHELCQRLHSAVSSLTKDNFELKDRLKEVQRLRNEEEAELLDLRMTSERLREDLEKSTKDYAKLTKQRAVESKAYLRRFIRAQQRVEEMELELRMEEQKPTVDLDHVTIPVAEAKAMANWRLEKDELSKALGDMTAERAKEVTKRVQIEEDIARLQGEVQTQMNLVKKLQTRTSNMLKLVAGCSDCSSRLMSALDAG